MREEIEVEGGFERRYRVWLVTEMTASWRADYEVPRDARASRGSLMLHVVPDEAPAWNAVVHGNMHADAPRAFLSTWDPNTFCLQLGESVYFIDVRSPGDAASVGDVEMPVILTDPERSQLIFVNCHAIEAWGASGKLWVTGLIGCGIEAARIDEGVIHAEVESFDLARRTRFALEASTGAFIGPEPSF